MENTENTPKVNKWVVKRIVTKLSMNAEGTSISQIIL